MSGQLSDESVEALDELVGIHAVDLAGLLNSLAAGHGTAHSVHTDGLEHDERLRRLIDDITNNGVFIDFYHLKYLHVLSSTVIIPAKATDFNSFLQVKKQRGARPSVSMDKAQRPSFILAKQSLQ